MRQYKVGIIGATGMVGQRFSLLLEKHPWFNVTVLAASSRNKGKTYKDACHGKWKMSVDMPKKYQNMVLFDAEQDIEQIASAVDFVFCAVDMNKEEVKSLEEKYAKLECPVCSNNSANRMTPDVPMIIPEINAHHTDIINIQKKRLGTKRGFIAVKSNCSIQSYVPALSAIWDFGIEEIAVCTYQAISGAGKTFNTMPDIIDNIIPYISGEEEKSEKEPLKIWGHIANNRIEHAKNPKITAQCLRVPISDGHMAAVFIKLKNKVSEKEIISRWQNFKEASKEFKLPSAPKQFLKYFEEENRPQTRLDRELENGMGISIGRLRKSEIYDYKFVSLSHNTLRGAAGGAVLMAELLCAKGFMN